MTGARRAVAFLTPVGGAAVPTPSALGWFPVVGAAMGALLGLLWWGMAHAWPAAVVAAVVVAADLALTGMLHLDGLVDAADGLLPHLSTARRLEVMREPTVGAFGIAAGGAFLLLRWAAIFSLRPSVLLMVGLWAASRAAMAVVATTVPYARAAAGGGLASAFLSGPDGPVPAPAVPSSTLPPPPPPTTPTPGAEAPPVPVQRGPGPRPRAIGPGVVAGALGLVIALGCLLASDPLPGAVALAGGVAAAAALVWLAVRRLGGFTGDVLGAAGVVLETVALVIAAAKW